MVQTVPSNDATAQQLANILGNFSFDAIRSEIDHRFNELRRDLEEKGVAQATEPVGESQPATTVTFQIETAKIPAPVEETAPVSKKVDYSNFIIPEEKEPAAPKKESSGGVDIMALLAAQAKRMESISPIDMMEIYGESYSEITLEELEKYINKHYK